MVLFKLRPNETVAIKELSETAPGTYYQPLWAEGNALVSTVFVESISTGASIMVTFEDVGLSDKSEDKVWLGGHEILDTANAISKTSITRFHNRPRIKTVISGGTVTYGQWLTLKTEAVSDIQFGLGKTTVYTGSTTIGTVTSLPPVVGQPIQQMSIRCAIDQTNSYRLLFSIDGQSNWIKLAPGEAFSVAPRGEIRQIHLDGGVNHSVSYEVVILTQA
jgi:hypothetical protein